MGTFRSASNAGNVSTDLTSVNVPVPAGAQAGDIVVVFFTQWRSDAVNPTMTPPSGFSLAQTWASSDGKSHGSVWWKRLTGADTGSYAWSWTPTAYTTAQALCFSDLVASGSPVGATNAVSGSFGTVTSMSAAATAGDVAIWGMYNDVAGTHTPPTGFTETADADSAAVAYEVVSATGTVTAAGGSVTSTSAAGAGLAVFAGASSTITVTLGVATETATARGVTRTKQYALAAPPAEGDAAPAAVRRKTRALGAAAEAAVARAVAVSGGVIAASGGNLMSAVRSGRRLINMTLVDLALPRRRAVASDGAGGQTETFTDDVRPVAARFSPIVDPSPIEQVEGIFGVPTAQVFFALSAAGTVVVGLREGDRVVNLGDGSEWVVVGSKTAASGFAVVDRILIREV